MFEGSYGAMYLLQVSSTRDKNRSTNSINVCHFWRLLLTHHCPDWVSLVTFGTHPKGRKRIIDSERIAVTNLKALNQIVTRFIVARNQFIKPKWGRKADEAGGRRARLRMGMGIVWHWCYKLMLLRAFRMDLTFLLVFSSMRLNCFNAFSWLRCILCVFHFTCVS